MINERYPKVKPRNIHTALVIPRIQHSVPRSVPQQKTVLVDLGLTLLAIGEMHAVDALTAIIRERKWSHE
jgi:hypothetical protein